MTSTQKTPEFELARTVFELNLPMTARQVADYLGVSQDVARLLLRAGKIRAFKVGGQWRTLRTDLMDYLMKQLQKT